MNSWRSRSSGGWRISNQSPKRQRLMATQGPHRPLLRCGPAPTGGKTCAVFVLASPPRCRSACNRADRPSLAKAAMDRIQTQVPGVSAECFRAGMDVYVSWVDKHSGATIAEEATGLARHLQCLCDRFEAVYIFSFSRASTVIRRATPHNDRIRSIVLIDPPRCSGELTSLPVAPTVVYRKNAGSDAHYCLQEADVVASQFSPGSRPRSVDAGVLSRSSCIDQVFADASPRTQQARKQCFCFFGRK